MLRDSITAQYAWTILGEFFTATVYGQQVDLGGMSEAERASHHNQVGWVTLLRDLWDRPDWSNEAFYDSTQADADTHTVQVEDDLITLELSDSLPHLAATGDHILVTLTVGGVALATITIPKTTAVISAQTLRVALMVETGFELCRAVVREALIGQIWIEQAWIEQERTEVPTLRQRLAASAQQRSHPLHPESTTIPTIALPPTVTPPANLLILGQRPGAIGSGVSRWASLPAAASEALVTMATVMQEPIAQAPDHRQPTALALYAPDAIVPLLPGTQNPRVLSTTSTPDTVQTSFNNRSHFETLFAKKPDPWHYTNAYEQTKYEQTLSLLPSQPIHHALELACAEGHFTAQLAPRVQSLLAVDISQIAVDRTAQRCAQFSHVRCQQMDMARDSFPQAQDLMVCSEVLYYIGGWDALRRFAQKVADALAPSGYFLTAHAHLVVDEPDRPGYNWDHPFGAKGISNVFSAIKTLRLVKELRTPLYRIQLFQKQPHPSWLDRWRRKPNRPPMRIEQPQPTPPPDVAAHTVLWQGGQPNRQTHIPTITTYLPILTYHRIAPSGSAVMSQWWLAPDAFAAQLRYLRDAGYYSISLERWR